MRARVRLAGTDAGRERRYYMIVKKSIKNQNIILEGGGMKDVYTCIIPTMCVCTFRKRHCARV